MKETEIKEFITREDKMIVAVKWLTDESYIDKILRGDRQANSEKAKGILNDLTKIAEDNKQWMAQENNRFERKFELIGI